MATSVNATLNIVNNTIANAKIVKLLRKYTGRKVELDVVGEDKLHEV